MTVKEIFNKAYGELPENVVGCYIGYDVAYSGVNTMPTVTCGQDGLDMYAWSAKWDGGSEWLLIDSENCGPFGPDISLRYAVAFEGFFESNYNLALAAELAQSQSEDGWY